MNETQTAAVLPDLDRLAERIERAAGMIQQMRVDRERLQRERDELARRVREVEDRLRGQDPAELLAELQTLKREQKEWHLERREVTVRIESLLRKLDKLEGGDRPWTRRTARTWSRCRSSATVIRYAARPTRRIS